MFQITFSDNRLIIFAFSFSVYAAEHVAINVGKYLYLFDFVKVKKMRINIFIFKTNLQNIFRVLIPF